MDNEVFTVGSLVENLNTGETGRITRRGTNHVICMTPEGTIFKSWLRDIMEAYEVGTDEYREYALIYDTRTRQKRSSVFLKVESTQQSFH